MQRSVHPHESAARSTYTNHSPRTTLVGMLAFFGIFAGILVAAEHPLIVAVLLFGLVAIAFAYRLR